MEARDSLDYLIMIANGNRAGIEEHNKECYETLKNTIEVLNLIIKKRVDTEIVECIKNSVCYNNYFKNIGQHKQPLTEEDFNKIKEYIEKYERK